MKYLKNIRAEFLYIWGRFLRFSGNIYTPYRGRYNNNNQYSNQNSRNYGNSYQRPGTYSSQSNSVQRPGSIERGGRLGFQQNEGYGADVIHSRLLDLLDPAKHMHPGIPYDFYSGYILMVAKNVDVDEENQVNTGWLQNNGPPWQICPGFTTVDICISTSSTNVHEEKERLPLIDCFDFSPKSERKLKKGSIELKKIIKGGPLFNNHPVLDLIMVQEVINKLKLLLLIFMVNYQMTSLEICKEIMEDFKRYEYNFFAYHNHANKGRSWI